MGFNSNIAKNNSDLIEEFTTDRQEYKPNESYSVLQTQYKVVTLCYIKHENRCED